LKYKIIDEIHSINHVFIKAIKMLVRSCITHNFGDSINKELVRLISGQVPIIVNNSFSNPKNETIYMCVGSILGWSTSSTVVWGSGLIKPQKIQPPKQILAVRGKLTRNELIKQGIKTPEIYGDPCLLLPRYYNPKLDKKYKVSIILHHVDKILMPKLMKKFPNAHFIDIQQEEYKFLDEIIQSEYIISSALHGCIMAYAYNVPYKHKQFSNNLIGGDFKFRDFESSKSELDLDKLYEVCPFKKEK